MSAGSACKLREAIKPGEHHFHDVALQTSTAVLIEASLRKRVRSGWGRTHPGRPTVLTDMLHVLLPRAASLPPSSSQEPTPSVPQGVHVLLTWRADGFPSLNVFQRHPDILSAPVG